MKTGDSRKAFDASLMGMVGGFISSFFLISAANMMVQGIHYCRSRIAQSNTEHPQGNHPNKQPTLRDTPRYRHWSTDAVIVSPAQQNDLQTCLIDDASKETKQQPVGTDNSINSKTTSPV